MKKNRYVSLIEILVVISIIAILASILLPVLGKARRTSKVVLSINNLKQLYLGANMYVLDNDGKFFRCSVNPHENETSVWWGRKVYEAIKPGSSYIMGAGSSYHDLHACPIITTEGQYNLSGNWRGFSSYSLNRYFNDSHRKMSDIAGEGKLEVFMGAAQPLTNWRAYPRLDSTDITNSGSWTGLTYVYPKSKSLGSFIDGSARLISVGEGAMMSPLVGDGSTFE
ncbi:hypothetical protein LNTAR_09514 [Lentisphaera araneosa HTCC2155]|jgi:type II secretory pathway pseudopilin PulG|uniref:Uncharacterized protein n=1 Tax=Lentisphaera araneosa HTCC2155 TaxID=313628 RepID=A6DIE4_9BACT|nr:prepilin-type N-terminal cleavage/methylation domain-containing protein [Lentisphaera araneosa]EDM28798.1 hypothetical protein LNTAR_09514 [Lentisphaera araneosa HTCC2155]